MSLVYTENAEKPITLVAVCDSGDGRAGLMVTYEHYVIVFLQYSVCSIFEFKSICSFEVIWFLYLLQTVLKLSTD